MSAKRKLAKLLAVVAVAIMVAVGLVATNNGSAGAAAGCSTASVDNLGQCSDTEIRSIYNGLTSTTEPVGCKNGKVMAGLFTLFVSLYWSGKCFNGPTVTNVGWGGMLQGYPGKVTVGPSRLDGKPTLKIDYSGTALSYMQDEIRQAGPNLWLGYALNSSDGSVMAPFTLS